MSYSVGLDVGGTKILGALVDDGGARVLEVLRPSDRAAWPDVALEVVQEVLSRAPGGAASVGLAVAAWVQQPSGRLAYAPNLQITDRDLPHEIEQRFGLPAWVENDASAAAWAEYRFGAGRSTQDMLMVTVGTGIGGGAVLAGELYRGARGFAAEFGHITVQLDGPRCPCGNLGCLEAMASGRALERMARARLSRSSEVLELAGKDPDAITGAMVGRAAMDGDAEARGLVEELGRNLGVGIAGLAKAFDPQAIVVGGGVSELGDLLLAPARAEVVARYRGQVDPPQVLSAALGNESGVVGAANLALRRTLV